MANLTPRPPKNRSLRWPDNVLDLQDALLQWLDVPLYIVGGAVRDAFSHRPVKDLDLATPGDSIRIARTIANRLNGDVYVMDAERGVARALVDTNEGRLTIDVAYFRGPDLLADLEGRDFTINAMAVDMHGDLNLLIDPLNGESDAVQKVLRRCTPQSLADDPIRALRAVRQSVQFGFKIEPDTRADIRAQASHLLETSPERVRDEFFALLALPDARMGLRVADTLGLLQPIVPEIDGLRDRKLPPPHVFDAYTHTLEAIDRMAAIINNISYQRSDNTAASFGLGMLAIQFDRFRAALNDHIGVVWPQDRSHRALLIFAALIYVAGDTPQASAALVSERADALRLSTPEKKRLAAMIANAPHAQSIDTQSALALHRYWYPLGEMGVDACLLGLTQHLATYGIELKQDDWLQQVERSVLLLDAYFTRYENIVSPLPFINGDELMDELQLEAGPIIGKMLTHIREGQVTGAVTSREEALALAQQVLRQSG